MERRGGRKAQEGGDICIRIADFREGDGNPLHTLAWKIPWMEEPGRLQSMGLLRVGHD